MIQKPMNEELALAAKMCMPVHTHELANSEYNKSQSLISYIPKRGRVYVCV